MNSSALMILGAGNAQVPIIKKAKNMGFEVIVVSIAGNYPGFGIANRSYEIDVRDKEEILRVARKERISGILTDQTDLPVTTVAYVAEKMGLPGIGYECALNFRDKFKMRQLCEDVGIPVPRYFRVLSREEAHRKAWELGFPVIIKPVDNQGSRGVFKVNCKDDLNEKFQMARHFSSNGAVIVEEYFSGREVVVQGFSSDFRFVNLAIGDREYFDLPDLFIPKRTIFPSLLNENLKQRILQLNIRLVNSFSPRFGITHNEYLVNEETGEIRLVEAAIRGGGVFISSDLVPIATGIDINKLLIDHSTDVKQSVRIEERDFLNNSSAYVSFYLPAGKVCRVQGIDEISALPGVHRSYVKEFELGEPVLPLKDKTMRLGPILIAGKSRENCESTIQELKDILIIEVSTPYGICGIKW